MLSIFTLQSCIHQDASALEVQLPRFYIKCILFVTALIITTFWWVLECEPALNSVPSYVMPCYISISCVANVTSFMISRGHLPWYPPASGKSLWNKHKYYNYACEFINLCPTYMEAPNTYQVSLGSLTTLRSCFTFKVSVWYKGSYQSWNLL